MTNAEILEIVQSEAAAWTLKNFPDQKPHQPLLGMVEEVGELWDALSSEAELDALADAMIFAINFCTHLEIRAAEIWEAREPFASVGARWHSRALSSALGRVSHCYLKSEQGIRGTRKDHLRGMAQALARVFAILEVRARAAGADLVPVVLRVWREEVEPRSWSRPSESQLTLPALR